MVPTAASPEAVGELARSQLNPCDAEARIPEDEEAEEDVGIASTASAATPTILAGWRRGEERDLQTEEDQLVEEDERGDEEKSPRRRTPRNRGRRRGQEPLSSSSRPWRTSAEGKKAERGP